VDMLWERATAVLQEAAAPSHPAPRASSPHPCYHFLALWAGRKAYAFTLFVSDRSLRAAGMRLAQRYLIYAKVQIGKDRPQYAINRTSLPLMYTLTNRALMERTLTAWVDLSLLFSGDA
jgi:hypothetical protein